MHKKLSISLIAVLLLGVVINPGSVSAASASYTAAETSISQITSVQELKDLAKFITKQIKLLRKGGTSRGSSSKSTSTAQNLSISSITVAYPRIGGGTTGVLDQVLEVEVKNNQYGSAALTYEKFKYAVYLYEVVDGKKEKIRKAATGEAYVPYANGYSSFKVNIEGGLPFDGERFEREYIAEVVIDTGNKVRESNEKDNKKWSDPWVMEHYKG